MKMKLAGMKPVLLAIVGTLIAFELVPLVGKVKSTIKAKTGSAK